MDISVIIPAHNEELTIGEQLDALLAQEWDGEWEVVVVDNASNDGTCDVVRRLVDQSERFRLVHADERADKSYALNQGVEKAKSDRLVFCDADDVVAPGWLEAMVRGLEDHQVVTGPNELHRLNPPWLANSRGESGMSPVGTFCGIFPAIRGNNWATTRDVWIGLSGMNEAYHPVEDMEFSLRCWLNGVEVVGLPDAIVHYRYRKDARSLWRQGFAYGSHRPLIAKLLKEAGKPTPPKFGGWKSWLLLVTRLPTVVTKTGRARWLWIAGNRFGQVAGSIRHRTLML